MTNQVRVGKSCGNASQGLSTLDFGEAMTLTTHHPVALSGGGTIDRPRESRYANDSRVVERPDGYAVSVGDVTYVVWKMWGEGWGIDGPDGLLEVAGGGCATGIATADQAIGALIGDPDV